MPKIDVDAVPQRKGTGYPVQFNVPCAERQRLGDAGPITDFGINFMHLPPGNWSSQRHGTHMRTSSSTYSKAS